MDTIPNLKDSEIRKFYAGKTIFLTDCVAFPSKCIVEKLVRACPDIKKIYVLVNSENEVKEKEDMKQYLENVLFDEVRKARPSFETTIVPIRGDITKSQLGMSIDDHRLVAKDTQIMIHNNATEMFDERVSRTLRVNVLGTMEVLRFASACERLQCFVYVSSAFAQCAEKFLEERLYRSSANLKLIEDMIRADEESIVGMTSNSLKVALGDWPNVNLFSRAVAEDVVREYSKKSQFPCIVYRPSFATSAWKEPIPGWLEDPNTPLIFGHYASLGYIHVAHMKNNAFDIVPVDMMANALLALIWHTLVNRKDLEGGCAYNYCSSAVNPISLREIVNTMFIDGEPDPPSIKAVWYYSILFTGCYYGYLVLHVLLNLFLAVVGDLMWGIVIGVGPRMICTTWSVSKQLEKYAFFGSRKWRFDLSETKRMWDLMSPVDRQAFFCDLRELSWKEYLAVTWTGMRTYLLKDPSITAVISRDRYNLLKIAHYTFLFLPVLAILFFLLF